MALSYILASFFRATLRILNAALQGKYANLQAKGKSGAFSLDAP
ncbi:MAG: hypothetical protein O2838_04265 [Proteobacteria bacterium]|nr:hypothetical protein [Pseudomonadota bacterium]